MLADEFFGLKIEPILSYFVFFILQMANEFAACKSSEKDFFLLPYLALTLVFPLDGMARNYYFFYMDTQEHAIHHVWIHLIPTSLYPRREEKHLD